VPTTVNVNPSLDLAHEPPPVRDDVLEYVRVLDRVPLAEQSAGCDDRLDYVPRVELVHDLVHNRVLGHDPEQAHGAGPVPESGRTPVLHRRHVRHRY